MKWPPVTAHLEGTDTIVIVPAGCHSPPQTRITPRQQPLSPGLPRPAERSAGLRAACSTIFSQDTALDAPQADDLIPARSAALNVSFQ